MNKKLKAPKKQLLPNIVIPTRAARHLLNPATLQSLSNIEGCRVLIPEPNKDGSYQFPDGEIYLRLPGLANAGEFGPLLIAHIPLPVVAGLAESRAELELQRD